MHLLYSASEENRLKRSSEEGNHLNRELDKSASEHSCGEVASAVDSACLEHTEPGFCLQHCINWAAGSTVRLQSQCLQGKRSRKIRSSRAFLATKQVGDQPSVRGTMSQKREGDGKGKEERKGRDAPLFPSDVSASFCFVLTL